MIKVCIAEVAVHRCKCCLLDIFLWVWIPNALTKSVFAQELVELCEPKRTLDWALSVPVLFDFASHLALFADVLQIVIGLLPTLL